MSGNDLGQSFGYAQVDSQERRRRIRKVFDSIAQRYDLMNDLMSFGIHRLWKRKLARLAPAGTDFAVDLAGGTGDVARLLTKRGIACVLVCDPAAAMMAVGKDRIGDERISWLAAEGEKLPLADQATSLMSVAFGLRNMTDPDAALTEACRVLKPGGILLCLEFSTPAPWIKPFYDLHSFLLIPFLGWLVAGDKAAYRYLVESIRKFPDQEKTKGMMERAGFSQVTYDDLFFGIACLHVARKALA